MILVTTCHSFASTIEVCCKRICIALATSTKSLQPSVFHADGEAVANLFDDMQIPRIRSLCHDARVLQKEATQATCELATRSTMEFVLGQALPGKRNGSQLWLESFNAFLKGELQINEFPVHPSLLKSNHCERLLLLHVGELCI